MARNPKKKKRGRATPLTPTNCPCGGGPYAQCCGPLHTGEREADSPEVLMRSRYSAFVVHNADYLWKTLHVAHDDRGAGQVAYCEQLSRSFSSLRYTGLRVIEVRAPSDGSDGAAGQVLFHATIQQHKRDRSLVELSNFALDDGAWRYLSGVTRAISELSHAPEQMSIEHWQCGHDHHH